MVVREKKHGIGGVCHISEGLVSKNMVSYWGLFMKPFLQYRTMLVSLLAMGLECWFICSKE